MDYFRDIVGIALSHPDSSVITLLGDTGTILDTMANTASIVASPVTFAVSIFAGAFFTAISHYKAQNNKYLMKQLTGPLFGRETDGSVYNLFCSMGSILSGITPSLLSHISLTVARFFFRPSVCGFRVGSMVVHTFCHIRQVAKTWPN